MTATYHPRPLTLVASVPMTKHLAALVALGEGRWIDGYDDTYDGITMHLSAGSAIVNRTDPRAAYYVTSTTTIDQALTDNATNYVWLSYDASIVVTTTPTQPDDTIALYQVTTVAGAVSGTPVDVRSAVLDIETAVRVQGADLDGNEITGLGAPTAPDSAARLQDVSATSLAIKDPVRMASTANLTLSGLQTVDGVVGTSQDRVGAFGQTTQADRGIYVMQSGAWVRSTDFDASGDVAGGMLIAVSEGTANGGAVFGLDTDAPIVLGTTSLTFSRKDVQAHELLTNAHSATDAATPSRIIIRDGAGRAKVADGAAAGDIATKGQMDTAVASEASTRSAADISEANTRAAADSAESTARSNGDAAAIATAEAYSVQRGNHTGTQAATTISDFDSRVRTSTLNEMTAPTADLSINNHKLTNVTDPTDGQDAATKAFVLAQDYATEAYANAAAATAVAPLLGNVTAAPSGTNYSEISGHQMSAGTQVTHEQILTARTLTAIYVKNTGGAMAAGSTVFTVRKNDGDTALTVTYTGSEGQNTLKSLTGQSVAFVNGDRVTMKIVAANQTSANIAWAVI